ncbi:hypothetical protein B1B_15218, partial [mine drainage metagenome]
MLVDAGLVRESVVADDGLVARDLETDGAAQRARRRVQARAVDAGVQRVAIGARAQRHHHFLKRGVAGALADAVEGAFDLARAGS